MNEPAPARPALEDRFQQPDGWRWGYFTGAKGIRLRYGMALPPGGKPSAVVVGLQGLSEFTEKYFETARGMLARNLAFCMMDWRGHGKSDRFLKNPHRRHSNGFGEDIGDLQTFIQTCVRPAARSAPLVMLAHSMGGNIGLNYLAAHPGVFSCAAFSAPMIQISAIRNLPGWLAHALSRTLREVAGRHYIFGGSDWRADMRSEYAAYALSADPARNAVHNAWCLADPTLQVGSVTYGWLHEAITSCHRLQRPGAAANIAIPSLFAAAGHDRLVDGAAIARFAEAMPHARVIRLPDAHHEILMERDGSRNAFLSAFDALLAAHLPQGG